MKIFVLLPDFLRGIADLEIDAFLVSDSRCDRRVSGNSAGCCTPSEHTGEYDELYDCEVLV